MKTKLSSYAVGLVTPRVGLTDSQLAIVIAKLQEIGECLDDGAKILLYAASYNRDDPERGLHAQVLNLRIRHKVNFSPPGLRIPRGR